MSVVHLGRGTEESFLADLALERPFGKIGMRLTRRSTLDAGKGNPGLHGGASYATVVGLALRILDAKLVQGSEGVEGAASRRSCCEPHWHVLDAGLEVRLQALDGSV